MGKCPSCNSWDSIIEENLKSSFTYAGNKDTGKSKKIEFFQISSNNLKSVERIKTGIGELDTVLGGGIVRGSVVLIGGSPGIGKSTLALQFSVSVSLSGSKSVYVSGEEAISQIYLRASRLKLDSKEVSLASSTNISDIISSCMEKYKTLDLLVIDSIQTMFMDSISSAPGTVSQVRACSYELINFAKAKNIAVIIIGHITKDGSIAGPKVLEHMVDAVLYFEGEKGNNFRFLRSVKNRFGATNETGVFEMKDDGLKEVKNPSALFLMSRREDVAGSVVFAGIEGSRPLLIEVQSLIAPSYMASPRRSVVGWDINRLSMIIAILNRHYGIFLGDKEVYLNIAGGLKVMEAAIDLSVAVSLISSFYNIELSGEFVVFGELSLSGEVRTVAQIELRLKEAKKMGFSQAIVPYGKDKLSKGFKDDFVLHSISHIKDLFKFFKKTKTTSG